MIQESDDDNTKHKSMVIGSTNAISNTMTALEKARSKVNIDFMSGPPPAPIKERKMTDTELVCSLSRAVEEASKPLEEMQGMCNAVVPDLTYSHRPGIKWRKSSVSIEESA